MSSSDIKRPFGMSVRIWRRRLGISQEELAERAKLHRTYICDVEWGTRNVSLESIDKLARALEISIPSLLSYTLDPATDQLLPAPLPGPGLLDILLIEDSAEDVELTLRALKAANIANRIHVMRDGAEALSFLFYPGKHPAQPQDRGPQLILLDLNLPKIDGFEVLRQSKADPRTCEIPIIVLTSSTSGHDLALCKRLGADAFIPKPVDLVNFCEVAPRLSFQWVLLKPVGAPT